MYQALLITFYHPSGKAWWWKHHDMVYYRGVCHNQIYWQKRKLNAIDLKTSVFGYILILCSVSTYLQFATLPRLLLNCHYVNRNVIKVNRSIKLDCHVLTVLNSAVKFSRSRTRRILNAAEKSTY